MRYEHVRNRAAFRRRRGTLGTRLEQTRKPPPVSPLVGRSEEVRSIADFLSAATDSATGLQIEGDPGIGKTTLWLDALQRARHQGIRVLATRASEAESVLAYAGLADLLTEVDHGVWADLPPPQRRALAAALLSEEQTAVRGVEQRAVGAAFLTVLARLAGESPVLVAVDDMQWLDGSTRAAVAFAARRLSGPVAWLCTQRSGTASSSGRWLDLSRPDAVRRVRLPPLSVRELHDALIAQLEHPIPRPRLLRIHQVSGGNPFYALELAREIDQGGAGLDLRLPDSLSEVTHSRISRFDDDAAEALLAIASLADPAIRVVAQAIDVAPPRLLEMLGEAETRQIVTIDGISIRFTHPLLAHAVRVRANPLARRTIHRRLAQVVTEPELRARHLALADPVGEPETLSALDAGADVARGRGAPAAAAELLEMAIGLGGATEDRLTLLAQCLFDAGDPRRAREALETAAELAAGPRRAKALQQLAMVRLYDDSFLEAAQICQQAVVDCGDDAALRVTVMTTLAFAQLNTGERDAALATAEQAVTVAENTNLPDALCRALSMRAIMRFMNGEGIAPSDLNRIAALDRLDTAMPVSLRPSVQTALLRGWTGEFAAARNVLAQLAQRCEAVGEEGELIFLEFQLVLFDTWLCELGRAAEVADEAQQRARQLGGGAALFIALSLQATVAAYQGRVEEARRHIQSALTAGVGSGYNLMLSWVISVHGFLELSLGDHAGALAALEPLLPMVYLVPRYTEAVGAGFVPDAAEALINLGRLDEAERLVAALESNGARLERAWMLAVGTRCRALLSAARGDVEAAVTHAQAALVHHDRVDMPFERARTLLVLGRLERRLRHWRAAAAVLSEALLIFESVGTPLWAEQARADLDRGPPGGPDPPV